jgi:MinD-like ATPase involved in chromosome partitioning or flagellar assembly
MTAAGDRRLTVSVDSPSGRHAIDMPLDRRVEDLMPALVQACEGGGDGAGWKLAPQGEAPIEGSRTLGECGLFRGAVLVLAPPPPGEAADHVLEGTGGISIASPPALARRLAGLLTTPEPSADTGRAGREAYIRMLEDAIAASRPGGSTVVAVISDRPGAGATTITALLATLINELRADRVAVVDANPESAALSHWMSPDSGVAKDSYSSLFGPSPTPGQVQASLVSIAPRLWVLPASAGQSSARSADAAAWRRLINHLRRLHNVVIVDCGAGMHRPAGQGALGEADQIVLVRNTAGQGPDAIAADVSAARSDGRAVVLVANQARRPVRARSSAGGVQQVTIAYEKDAAQRLKTRGFSWTNAPASWQEAVRELAATLAGSASAPAP